MSTTSSLEWSVQNQAWLVREFDALRRRLGAEPAADAGRPEPIPIEAPPALELLAQRFDLSPFEREILLLCAGVEMDSALAAWCTEATGHPLRHAVTFSLALAVLTAPHWSALAPSRPLRRCRLIEIDTGHGVTSAPLRIEERVLHYLAGVNRLDERLTGILQSKAPPVHIADEHQRLACGPIAHAFDDPAAATVLNLCGDDRAGQEDVAALIASRTGHDLYVLRHEDTPSAGPDIDQFVQLWIRESTLLPAFLLLQWHDDTPSVAARQLAERLPGPLLIASRDAIRLARFSERVDVNKPGPASQRQLWQAALGPVGERLNGMLDHVSQQFRLSTEGIVAIGASVQANDDDTAGERFGNRLWDACRAVSRPSLEGLAERICPQAGWEDLLLPEPQKETLRQLAAQSRYGMKVYETWGFSAKGRRGLGLSALFAGPSGTGKTLAAEVLAKELALDLYRIDLSSVVSKYIGETEKNLKRVFDAAESGGAILLFDEADALFGKRSEVKDSHDRYANIEVGYLLQRMESFRGLAILTTNLKSSLDKAFSRRLRFTIDFPFPDVAQREAIWARVFPAATPTRDLRPECLATLNMTGGNIRNIALNAAFLAAQTGEPVGMAHVLRATRMEAAKIDRPLSELETRGWV